MTKYAYLGLLMSAVMVIACADTNQAKTNTAIADFDSQVGWLHGNCLAIKNPAIANGTELSLIHLNESQQMMRASIASHVDTGEACSPLLQGHASVNLNSAYSFYAVNSEADIDLAIGVIGRTVEVDKYAFDYCTTAEGIVYSLKDATQRVGKVLWQGYYYLDYDTEETCEITE